MKRRVTILGAGPGGVVFILCIHWSACLADYLSTGVRTMLRYCTAVWSP